MRSGHRSSRSSRRTSRPTTSPVSRHSSTDGCDRLPPRACRRRVRPRRACATATWWSSETRRDALLDAGPCAGTSRLHASQTAAAARSSPGSCSRATRCSSATSAAPTCMRRADPEPLARELYASVNKLLELDDDVIVYPSHYRGLGLRPRALEQPVLDDRLRAASQRGAAAYAVRTPSPGAARRSATALRRSRRRSSRQTAAAPPRMPGVTGVQLGLRANAGQFALLVGLNALVGAMVGLERTVLPLVGEQDFGLDVEDRDPLLHRRVRAHEGAHEPRRRHARRPRRAQAAARRRLAARTAGAAPDRHRSRLGLIVVANLFLGCQPGPRLVDDRRDEDRPRRPEAARPRARVQRVRRLPRRCDGCVSHRRPRGVGRATHARLGRRCRNRARGARRLGRVRS